MLLLLLLLLPLLLHADAPRGVRRAHRPRQGPRDRPPDREQPRCPCPGSNSAAAAGSAATPHEPRCWGAAAITQRRPRAYKNTAALWQERRW
jgi:hypothetical protein